MPKLPPGIYHIRYIPTVPPPPIGGSYATNEGLNAQVSAKALEARFQQQVIYFYSPLSSEPSIIEIILTVGSRGFQNPRP